MMDMALDAVDLLNHLKWKSNVHLVGTSMGGSVAQLIVAYYPQYFASVCFTSTMAHTYLDFVSILALCAYQYYTILIIFCYCYV